MGQLQICTGKTQDGCEENLLIDPGKEDPLPAEQKEGSLCRGGNGLG